ncbi:ankyrin repeat domain-containing protein [Nonomuraea rhodomycinica]|uniref:Ankyrin repeat domain-containing protein n=1 Tax=Nonomuraea rhodomycinica TaxID=1712872 RepID=A0A7Y6MFT6_9ACTN|nr:ankyrin repeat domain-containing protein [Nonomuraea rhodomycinica]NUW45001.1 ankyrin repeat domain-containing protein [Nonomuraea rhodomycinica]
MTQSPAHLAVELEDLPALRELLDNGHSVEDPDENGWTLLHHAIDVEIDGHVQTGEPLHVDVTAYLLARGADPLASSPRHGTPLHQAESRRHWLAVEIIRAWAGSQV